MNNTSEKVAFLAVPNSENIKCEHRAEAVMEQMPTLMGIFGLKVDYCTRLTDENEDVESHLVPIHGILSRNGDLEFSKCSLADCAEMFQSPAASASIGFAFRIMMIQVFDPETEPNPFPEMRRALVETLN